MSENARGSVRVEQGPKRVRVYLGGELVADTRTPYLVWESPYYPTYYVPASDMRADADPGGGDQALAQPRQWRGAAREGGNSHCRRRCACATRTPRWSSCATWSGWTGAR